jgi:tRNA uridine 5-carbamoylmethylation protein Kti12
MIIVGYQGVGKSTLAANDITVIDLESSNFWYTIDGKLLRDSTWFIAYCNIAEHLSKQGYDVCVSSHRCVRQQLKYCTEHVVAVVPSITLKDEWIKKLKDRYDLTHKEKDLKALLNAEELFDTNIAEIKEDCENVIEIKSMKYDLGLLLHKYHKELGGDC